MLDAQEERAARERATKEVTSAARQNDPFLIYGPGVSNYFNLQEKLLWIFFVLTILSCFQMGIFRSFDGLGNLGDYVTTTGKLSFGNMGFSGTSCVKMPIDWVADTSVTLSIGCEKTTQITEVVSSGMMLDYAWGGWADAVHDCYIDPKN